MVDNHYTDAEVLRFLHGIAECRRQMEQLENGMIDVLRQRVEDNPTPHILPLPSTGEPVEVLPDDDTNVVPLTQDASRHLGRCSKPNDLGDGGILR